MGKLREKFTKERIKEFCNRVGGRIRTSKIHDTYACVIRTDELDWEKSYKLMQETKKLLQDIPEIQTLSVFSGDTDFSIQSRPIPLAEMWSYYTNPEEVEIGIQDIKGVRVFYISAKKSRELEGADVNLKFTDSRIAVNTAGIVTLTVEKGWAKVTSSVDLDTVKALERERVRMEKLLHS